MSSDLKIICKVYSNHEILLNVVENFYENATTQNVPENLILNYVA